MSTICLDVDFNNQVVLELTLSSSLANPFYLFEFRNDLHKNEYTYFTGLDSAPYKCRYNLFNIIETGATSVNLTASTVNLRVGSYTYNIFESTAMTLSKSATTGAVIATGKVIVNGPDNAIPNVYK